MDRISLAKVLSATAGRLVSGQQEMEFTEVTIDSRQVRPGALFVALKGERFDGHDFLGDVVNSGAKALVVQQEVSPFPGIAIIQVPDTLQALGEIAGAYRSQFALPVIGITGSNGKTSTKDLLAAILQQKMTMVKTEGNHNNEVGVPLTLFRLNAETEAAVVEMGMRGLGQISQLAKYVQPKVGIITNVGVTHLELLGSQEKIAQAKGELIAALPADGLGVLNGDDPFVRGMVALSAAPCVLYGIDDEALDYRAVELSLGDRSSSFKIIAKDDTFTVRLPCAGRHNVLNALAAVAVAKELGFTGAEIVNGLAQAELSGKRLNILEAKGYWVIDDTYNASPPSVKGAIDVLVASRLGQRKIAVLGDMLELGPQGAQFHQEVGAYARQRGVDLLYSFGENAREYLTGFQGGEHFEVKTVLIERLQDLAKPGDLFLVKGSRGMKLEEVVEALTI